MSTARPYEEQEDPGGMPATTTAPVTSTPVTSALVTPTLATSPARRCWSPRPASGRHLHWPTPRRNAASRCITIQVGENLAKTTRNGGGEVFPVQGDFSIVADVERVVTHNISAGSMAWSTMPPQGRAGTAEDCVGAYLFLSSALLSGCIAGHEVNGGQLMP